MSPSRLLSPIVGALLAVVLMSGCLGGGDRPDDTADPARLAVSFVGLGAPEGHETVVVRVTIDHIALLAEDDVWRDLLSEPVRAEVPFEGGFGEPALLADVPIPTGPYRAIEIVATEATVIGPDGEETATTESVACYQSVSLQIDAADVHELQLLLSGEEALQGGPGAWTFRPAVVGSFAPEDAEGEAAIGEPDCRPI